MSRVQKVAIQTTEVIQYLLLPISMFSIIENGTSDNSSCFNDNLSPDIDRDALSTCCSVNLLGLEFTSRAWS